MHHRRSNLIGIADACRACAKDDHALLAERLLHHLHGGKQARQGDGAGSLHVIIEGTDVLTVVFQNTPSVADAKVFPVQQRLRKESRGCLDIGIDKGIVALAAHSGMPIPQVERVIQQAFSIGADIQHYRNHARRVNTSSGGIDGQLANGDLDAPDAPIANTQDLFGIGGNNQVDVLRSSADIPQGRFDSLGVVNREIDAAWASVLVTVLLNRLCHGGIVDHRQHLGEVVSEQPVE